MAYTFKKIKIFLGADHFPLAWFWLWLIPELTATFLEGQSLAFCPFPPQFQQVAFTTKLES